MDPEIIFQLLKNGIIAGLLYGMFAYGLSLVLAATGIFHLAALSSLVGAAYGLWWFLDLGASATLAVLGALIVGGAVGLLTELLVYRPLRKVNASDLVMMVASLTVLSLSQALLAISFGSSFKAIPSNDFTSWQVSIANVAFTAYDLVVIGTSALVYLLMYIVQKRTKTGLAFRALGDGPELARMKGIRINRTYFVLFILAGSIAGLVGVLTGMQQSLSPAMGFNLLIMAVIALAVGGVGNMTGGLLAGLGVGLIESFLAYLTSVSVAHIVLFSALFFLVVFRPGGIRIQATREA